MLPLISHLEALLDNISADFFFQKLYRSERTNSYLMLKIHCRYQTVFQKYIHPPTKKYLNLCYTTIFSVDDFIYIKYGVSFMIWLIYLNGDNVKNLYVQSIITSLSKKKPKPAYTKIMLSFITRVFTNWNDIHLSKFNEPAIEKLQ